VIGSRRGTGLGAGRDADGSDPERDHHQATGNYFQPLLDHDTFLRIL